MNTAGKALKKAQTNDKSKPAIAGSVAGSSGGGGGNGSSAARGGIGGNQGGVAGTGISTADAKVMMKNAPQLGALFAQGMPTLRKASERVGGEFFFLLLHEDEHERH